MKMNGRVRTNVVKCINNLATDKLAEELDKARAMDMDRDQNQDTGRACCCSVVILGPYATVPGSAVAALIMAVQWQ